MTELQHRNTQIQDLHTPTWARSKHHNKPKAFDNPQSLGTIRRKHNIVRECIFKGEIRLDHVRTDENLAHPLTKWLVREKFHNTTNEIKLMPIYVWVVYDGNPT